MHQLWDGGLGKTASLLEAMGVLPILCPGSSEDLEVRPAPAGASLWWRSSCALGSWPLVRCGLVSPSEHGVLWGLWVQDNCSEDYALVVHCHGGKIASTKAEDGPIGCVM